MTTPRQEPTFPPDPQMHALAGWFMILLAIPLALWMAVRMADKIDARGWPRAEAVVVASELRERGGRRHDWCIALTYRYRVGAREYTSRRAATSIMSEAPCDASREVIQARFAQQQPGRRIMIRHHPTRPERAIVYLDGPDFADVFFSALALACFWGGALAIGSGRRLRVEQAALSAERHARMRQAGAGAAHRGGRRGV